MDYTLANTAGLDFSLNFPALTIQHGIHFHHYAIIREKLSRSLKLTKGIPIEIIEVPKIENWIEDIGAIANILIEILKKHGITNLKMEGYSFNSKSRFYIQIIEATAILKFLLSQSGIQVVSIPPTTIKKKAGKGNLNKEGMFFAFMNSGIPEIQNSPLKSYINENLDSIYIKKKSGEFSKILKPFEDVIDSVWVALTPNPSEIEIYTLQNETDL